MTDLRNINDVIHEWHEGAGPGLHLHEYIGMDKEVFLRWVTRPSSVTPEELAQYGYYDN